MATSAGTTRTDERMTGSRKERRSSLAQDVRGQATQSEQRTRTSSTSNSAADSAPHLGTTPPLYARSLCSQCTSSASPQASTASLAHSMRLQVQIHTSAPKLHNTVRRSLPQQLLKDFLRRFHHQGQLPPLVLRGPQRQLAALLTLFGRLTSSVIGFPSATDANPHCGLIQILHAERMRNTIYPRPPCPTHWFRA